MLLSILGGSGEASNQEIIEVMDLIYQPHSSNMMAHMVPKFDGERLVITQLYSGMQFSGTELTAERLSSYTSYVRSRKILV